MEMMKTDVNIEKDEYFDEVTEWMCEKWRENYEYFVAQLNESEYMRKLMDQQLGWPRKRKWDNNLVKRITNHGYFEQWKYVGMFCKLHSCERLTVQHIDKHIRRKYRFEQKYEGLNIYVLDPHMKITKKITEKMWTMSKELGKLSLMVAKKYGQIKTKKGENPFSQEQIAQNKLSRMINDANE